ncbi:hypothetical protein Tco_0772140 [Tanacetum coccineum]|uniref:Reverse transcriptase domain-containing protein n=1 Tax=Tanacetum coccineum TaxID=301880 RepID=A0ABQ4ZH34_9ASTR
MTNLTDMLTKFMNTNTASTSGSGSLPNNTVANLRGDMKAITTRSGVSYDGPQVPPLLLFLRWWNTNPSFTDALLHMPKFALKFRKLLNNKDKILDLTKTPEMDECLALADLGATINLMLLSVDYIADPQVPLILGRPFLRKALALIDVHGEQITLRHDDQSITFKVVCSRSTWIFKHFQEWQSHPNFGTNPFYFSPSLTPFEGGDFILEEIEACLTSKSISPGIDDVDFDPKEDLLTLERLLNSDPSSTLPLEEQKFKELKTVEPSSDELPELELKDLPPHLEYAFLEGTDKLPIIIVKDLKDEDKTALLKVLRSHKRVIAWKISDIKGIDPKFCTHKILMEDNVKPTVQHQRRVNPKIHEVIKKEVIKPLEAGLIYLISDSP